MSAHGHQPVPRPPQSALPVAIVGAGPIGLITALGLAYYGIPCVVYEDHTQLSVDTKAGTLLTRTLEIFRRYGVADAVLAHALRVDEIGEIDRATQQTRFPLRLDVLRDETRYPFIINLPQKDLEPILAQALARSPLVQIKMGHRVVRYQDQGDHVVLHIQHGAAQSCQMASFLLACDGGHSSVRAQMGVTVAGHSLPVKYALVDLQVDLDVDNPRDYPYLAYFSDPHEWMVLVRQPQCWRFLFPMAPNAPEPTADALRDKALTFIGQVCHVKVLSTLTYRVHHRVAQQWRQGRVLLMGDAAHLITPMWALGLNTGALDASNLPWRLAWFLRGWANEALLDGYECEQKPLAIHGSGEMAEAARLSMSQRTDADTGMGSNNWSNAYTRTMLGVKLGLHPDYPGAMVVRQTRPALTPGDRLPDYVVHNPAGQAVRLHDCCAGRFTALYFCDVRRRPAIPSQQTPALQHFAVSRYDAPRDSGLRARSLFDPGDALAQRLGLAPNTLVLVRPDEHIAAIVPMHPALAADADPHLRPSLGPALAQQAQGLYDAITGQASPANPVGSWGAGP